MPAALLSSLRNNERLQNEVFEIDVTETWPEWRAILRDPNYAKVDSGERHVFEIFRVDTSAVHLHYHRNGSLDDPALVPPIVMPEDSNSGASQPTAPCIAPSPGTPSPSQPVIGRREAVLTLTVLLNKCWNNSRGAVDITDCHAFDWKRFFANTMENREIAKMELEKVFALRDAENASPKLAVCTTGTRWKMMNPTQAHYKDSRKQGLRDMPSNWRMEPLFMQPKTAPRNWLRMY